jgi:excisionase family DNA binding protein
MSAGETAAQFGIPETMTAEQVADVLQMRPTTVTGWARNGNGPLRGVKVGNEWRFRVDDVQRLLNILDGDVSEPVELDA